MRSKKTNFHFRWIFFFWQGQQTYRNKEEDHTTERETAGVAQVPWNTQCDDGGEPVIIYSIYPQHFYKQSDQITSNSLLRFNTFTIK